MGNLKTEVSKAHTGEEVKEKISDTINEAGMVLDDEELDKVSGGEAVVHFRNLYTMPI